MSGKSAERQGSDGWPILIEGDWSRKKFELVSRYASAFNRAIKNKFLHRAYIDLFSGTGLVGIKGSADEVAGCAFRALDASPGFSHFRFCEINARYRAALEARILKQKPKLFEQCEFFEGDCNLLVDQILASLPKPSPSNTFLGFCLIDPFGASGFKFQTIEKFSRWKMDFLVLIPTGMDFRRNKNSLLENPELADDFLGQSSWRKEWHESRRTMEDFGIFMLDQFGRSMIKLKYKYNGPHESFAVKYPVQNVMLYHMAFFSRSDLGTKLFNQCKKYMTSQLSLLEG